MILVDGIISTTPVTLNENVDGTPYVNEEYLPAKISASEDNTFYVRYNAMRDEFEVKGANNQAYSLNRYRRDIVVEIIPLEKKYQVFGFLDDDENENFGYFVYLTDGNQKNVLFKKEKVTFINEKFAYTSYDTARPARYKRWDDKFFIRVNDERLLQEIPYSKKSFAKLFPDHTSDILDFMKSNKLKLRKEEDLKQILNYINTL
ncbi:MAG: hypothetical protein HRU26_13270 [Psychroserpens sp.]|nr:hypothetical protein [Psychroserpens sp.]